MRLLQVACGWQTRDGIIDAIRHGPSGDAVALSRGIERRAEGGITTKDAKVHKFNRVRGRDPGTTNFEDTTRLPGH